MAIASEVQAYNELQQNCNTCVYLVRVAFDRNAESANGLRVAGGGMHPGLCLNTTRRPLYPQGVGTRKIAFCPTDCMLQECYADRSLVARALASSS